MYYRIRLDVVNGVDSDALIELCVSKKHVIVHHELPHGNPHYHMFVETEINDKALRQRIKRRFNIQSSDYSVKKCDDDRINEYVQYMFNTKHGNKWELIDSNNFDDKLLDDLIQAAKKISNDYEAVKVSKSKGPTIWDIAMEVEAIVNPKVTVNNLGPVLHELKTREISDEIDKYTEVAIDVLRKYKKGHDEFYLRKIITTAITSNATGRQIMRTKMSKHFLS